MVQHHGPCPACGRSALSAQLVCRGGRNIVLEVSPHRFDRTVASITMCSGSTRRAEMERLADDFWITDRAGIGHAIAHPTEDPGS